MKYLIEEFYVEVQDHQYRIHPTENIILRERDPPTSLRTQYQVKSETQIRTNQKVIKSNNDELLVKIYPKNKQIFNQKFKPPNCPFCKQNIWLEFDKGYYCRNCEDIINKQKHQIDKRVRGQDHNFSAILSYANEKIREIRMNMVNTTYSSTEDMINELQELKGKSKLKFYKNVSNCYDIMNIEMDEDRFAKNAQGISKIYHEVLLLMKFLQIKPQVKDMNMNYYDLFYTVIKNRDKKEIVYNQYENEYINFNDFIIPRDTILK